ncbi:MAG: TOMM precursor leader peptide-binding protein [Gammaproteobacteria bacterium]|nr:TOMM precursor leader peptide-binding protein [Gammaproteobacteria bacterium]
MRRLKLVRNRRCIAIPGEGVYLVSETRRTFLAGRLYSLVVPLLDGRRSADDIAAVLDGCVEPAAVYFTLAKLEEKGYLVDSDDPLADHEAAYWREHGVTSSELIDKLTRERVHVTTLGNVDPIPLTDALTAAGIRVGMPASLGVVVTDDYLRSELGTYNRCALQTGAEWMLFQPIGTEVRIGPFFRPGYTGCWECLAQRLRLHRPIDNFLIGKGLAEEPIVPPASWTLSTMRIACNMAAAIVVRWLVNEGKSQLNGKVLTLDTKSWETRTHQLVRQPTCPCCGAAKTLTTTVSSFVPQSYKTTTVNESGHRTVDPEVTLARYEQHVSPITGVLTHLRRVPGDVDGVAHVYSAGPVPLAIPIDADPWHPDWRFVSAGKGSTDAQARASGLCEALERYSGLFQGDEPRRWAKRCELEGNGIPPNDCMLFSDRQFRERDHWNAVSGRYRRVPVPFDAEMRVEWSPVWSLTHQCVRYLPTAICYYSYAKEMQKAIGFADSNGVAAGNTIEEAVLQGFLELIERDSVALWWYNCVQRSGVDLHSFHTTYAYRVEEWLKGRGRDLRILDLTADSGISVFTALSRRMEGLERMIMGFGAHLDPEIALTRAVTELVQLLPNESRASCGSSAEFQAWLATADVEDRAYLTPSQGPERVVSDFANLATGDLRDDLHVCQDITEKLGLELLVLDQTRSDIGLPVARVIIPGMRHFWARFAPGRLYDIPVALGWLAEPRTEDQLNPIAMFM